MHRVAAVIAHLVVRRPVVMAIAGLLLAAGSVARASPRSRAFDSDILNLLPANNPAVQGLKIYNSEFTQARELAFLLAWEKAPADGDAFREIFVERLRSQPWVHRVLDAPPLEASGGRKSIHEILVPLLLNLPAEQFADADKRPFAGGDSRSNWHGSRRKWRQARRAHGSSSRTIHLA